MFCREVQQRQQPNAVFLFFMQLDLLEENAEEHTYLFPCKWEASIIEPALLMSAYQMM